MKVDKAMREKVVSWGASYYSVQSVECINSACYYLAPKGSPIHFDYGHLTQEGAEFLLSKLPTEELLNPSTAR